MPREQTDRGVSEKPPWDRMQGVENEPVRNPALRSGTEVRSVKSQPVCTTFKVSIVSYEQFKENAVIGMLSAIGAKQHTPVVKKAYISPQLQVYIGVLVPQTYPVEGNNALSY